MAGDFGSIQNRFRGAGFKTTMPVNDSRFGGAAKQMPRNTSHGSIRGFGGFGGLQQAKQMPRSTQHRSGGGGLGARQAYKRAFSRARKRG